MFGLLSSTVRRMSTDIYPLFPEDIRYFKFLSDPCILFRVQDWSEYNVWVRPSTGRLCVELTPLECGSLALLLGQRGFPRPKAFVCKLPEDWDTITSMFRWRPFSISTNVAVKLGSIRHRVGQKYENSAEIAFTPDCGIRDSGWSEYNWNPYVQSAHSFDVLLTIVRRATELGYQSWRMVGCGPSYVRFPPFPTMIVKLQCGFCRHRR
jgi:hypothetical protein